MITIDCAEMCLNRTESKRVTTIIPELIDEGYGFKIKLLNVATVKAMSDMPCISVYFTDLADIVYKELEHKENKTTAEFNFCINHEKLKIFKTYR
jgi:hypothetical protein